MKTIQVYILLAIMIILSSCTKNPSTNDNPNIESYIINETTDFSSHFYPATSTSPIYGLADIDKDGVADIQLSVSAVFLTTTKGYHSWLEISGIQTEIYFNASLLTFPVIGSSFYYAAALNKNTLINDETADDLHYAYTNIGSEYLDSLGTKTQIGALKGKGDTYIGFKFKKAAQNGGTIHFGWIKINVSADNRQVTIKEIAYHKKANSTIKKKKK